VKSIHSKDLEFLRKIRGGFTSMTMWPIKYEFTGEEIIERRGKRIKNQIRISDVIKTNNSEINIRIILP